MRARQEWSFFPLRVRYPVKDGQGCHASTPKLLHSSRSLVGNRFGSTLAGGTARRVVAGSYPANRLANPVKSQIQTRGLLGS